MHSGASSSHIVETRPRSEARTRSRRICEFGFTSGKALDDAELKTLLQFYLKAFRTNLFGWASEEVLTALRYGGNLEEPLDRADGPGRSSDVVCKQETPAGA